MRATAEAYELADAGDGCETALSEAVGATVCARILASSPVINRAPRLNVM